MKPYWFKAWWLRQRVATVVCRVIGHRLETRRDVDIEWDVCNRCRLYMTEFRSLRPGMTIRYVSFDETDAWVMDR